MIKTIKTAAIVVALLPTSAAFAQGGPETIEVKENAKLVWGGGAQASSTYSGKYVPQIIGTLANNRLGGYQWGGISEGTNFNVAMVRQNPTHIGLGQLDMVKDAEGITILHDNIGPECLYLVTNQPGYENFGHVLGNSWDLVVATGGELSGSYGTWQVLAGLYDELSDMPVNNVGGSSDIVDAVLKSSEPTVGFFVQRPDPNLEVFKKIEAEGMTYVPVVDFELENIYDFFDLKVANTGTFGLDSKTVITACTSVALFTGVTDGLEGRNLKRLEATIQRAQAADSGDFTPTTRDFRDMLQGLKAAAGQQTRALMEAARETTGNLVDQANDALSGN